MFGHQDDQQTLNDAQAATQTAPTNDDWAQPLDDGHDELGTGPMPSDSQPQEETPVAGNDELLAIKQQALGQLSPIVSHLDQTPEERFRTTMMMIQASDNQSLIKTAYDAAQQISDEKVKAQALLDIVNEINYFTHQG